jgi:hypothetical protein
VRDGVLLGRWVKGDKPLPVRGSGMIWPFEQLKYHAVIFGEPGSGKTETAMRMAHDVAAKAGAPVFWLDAVGDADLAERFTDVMGAVGRRTFAFPDEPFNAWRDNPDLIADYILDMSVIAADRDLAELILVTVLKYSPDPPRSSDELLERLDYDSLMKFDPLNIAQHIDRESHQRMLTHLGQAIRGLDGNFDGDRSWGELDAGYFRVDAEPPVRGTSSLPRFLLNHWTLYLRRCEPAGPSLMVISGLTEDLLSAEELRHLLGQAKLFNAGVILIWDSPEDIGPKGDSSKIFAAVWTTIVHRSGRLEGIDGIIGEKTVPETETAYHERHGELQPEFLVRQVEKPKLSQADFANLPTGTAWIVESGGVAKVQIEPA